jgi:hypothetical protein
MAFSLNETAAAANARADLALRRSALAAPL